MEKLAGGAAGRLGGKSAERKALRADGVRDEVGGVEAVPSRKSLFRAFSPRVILHSDRKQQIPRSALDDEWNARCEALESVRVNLGLSLLRGKVSKCSR
jgi:hypothetical protein